MTISLVLLVGAGLFLRTLQNLRRSIVGFNARNVLLFRISPALNRYDPKKRNLTLRSRLEKRLRGDRRRAVGRLVESAAHVGPRSSAGDLHPGPRVRKRPRRPRLRRRRLTLVLRARWRFRWSPAVDSRESDTEDAPPVAVINEEAARRYFPNESPLGRRFRSEFEESGEVEIVGILRDAKYNSVRAAAPPTLYKPFGKRHRSPRHSRCERRAIRLPRSRPSARRSEPSIRPAAHQRHDAIAGSREPVPAGADVCAGLCTCSEGWRCSWRRSGCSA